MSRLLENGLKSVNPRGYQGSQGWLWWALTKKHRPDEIVAKLRDADAMLNAGKDLAAVLHAQEEHDPGADIWDGSRFSRNELPSQICPQICQRLVRTWVRVRRVASGNGDPKRFPERLPVRKAPPFCLQSGV